MEPDFGSVVLPVSFDTYGGSIAMTDTFDREMLSRLRAISNNCIGSWAVRRLRIMADEIEQRLAVERQDDFENGARLDDQR
jgi:hypothetical protein